MFVRGEDKTISLLAEKKRKHEIRSQTLKDPICGCIDADRNNQMIVGKLFTRYKIPDFSRGLTLAKFHNFEPFVEMLSKFSSKGRAVVISVGEFSFVNISAGDDEGSFTTD